jgi:transcriptional regulator with PAS, ATPase and Fis domain
MQSLLLRFLETGELQKVGAERAGRNVNVRVIAATNRRLDEMIERGLFREDLFYRLNVIHIIVPPLRERKEDIPLLVEQFLEQFSGNGYIVRAIAPDAIAALGNCSWPGNVRELQNVIERLVVTGRREVVRFEDLPPDIREPQRIAPGPGRERRPTVSDDLYKRLIQQGESFWTAVYPLYMQREITRGNVREIVGRGLQDARGNYKIVARLFNMGPEDYKRFLNFLRKHDCQLPFKEYR